MVRRLVVAVAAVGLVSACGNSSPDAALVPGSSPVPDVAGYSITAALDEIPIPMSTDSFEIRSADLARATTLTGQVRPESGDVDALLTWATALSGTDRAGGAGAVLWPEVLAPSSLPAHADVADELGVSLWTVDSFVELSTPPQRFTALTGDFDDDVLARAVGDAPDGTRSLGGDDYGVDLAGRTVARPTGMSLHLAMLDDDTVALSHAAPPLEALRSGEVPTASGDDGVLAVAEHLDAGDVYSAWIGRNTFVGGSDSLPAEFDTLGIGFDEQGRVVVVYRHGDEAAAERNAEALPGIGGDLPLVLDEVTRDGTVVTAVFTLGEVTPAAVWAMPIQRAPLFAHVA